MEIRGFEKFLEGAAVEEAPRITPRICGVCQTAHHIVSAKASDAVFGLQPPETAQKLRELTLLGQYIHSHALHFYFLGAPDLVLGPDLSLIHISEPTRRTPISYAVFCLKKKKT